VVLQGGVGEVGKRGDASAGELSDEMEREAVVPEVYAGNGRPRSDRFAKILLPAGVSYGYGWPAGTPCTAAAHRNRLDARRMHIRELLPFRSPHGHKEIQHAPSDWH
jgi:hypothetical protein